MSSTIKDNHMRAPQVEYALISSLAPKYKWLKVPLNNFTVPEIKIGATTNTMLEWKLPTQVYNLSRSVIEYAERVPAQPKQTVVWEDAFTLASSISFGAAGGMDLVNLQGAQKYSKIMRKINTDLDEMLTNDQTSGLYSSNVLASQNIVPYTLDAESSPAGFHRGVVNYLENRYVNTLVNWAADPPVGAIGGIDRYRRIPLGIYKGTLLGDDRDFYGGTQEMYLRVNAGPGDMMAFHADNALVPSAIGSSIAAGSEITINNVCLWLCIEDNPEVVRILHEKYRTNTLKYRIPYTTVFKTPSGGMGQQANIQIQLSQQYGKTLKSITHTVWSPSEKLHTAYDCNNYNGVKITNYQTFMDSRPLQDRILSCMKPFNLVMGGDDWLENKKFLKKKSAILNKEHYGLNWFHRDQFYEPHDPKYTLPEENFNGGLSMDSARTWQFSGTTHNTVPGILHYTFAEFTRDIDVTPLGVNWI